MLQTKEEPDKGPKTGRVWPTVGQARKSWGDVGGVGLWDHGSPLKALALLGMRWGAVGR